MCNCKNTSPIVACCGQPKANVIDLEKPIKFRDIHGEVRLLTKYIKYNAGPIGHHQEVTGALVACNTHMSDNQTCETMYVIDPVTGIGTGITTGSNTYFMNEPEVLVDETFINYYENAPEAPSVHEVFDTRKEADDNDLFYSRDCCVKLRITKIDGVWAASAEVEAK